MTNSAIQIPADSVWCPKCGGYGGQDASEVMWGERGWLSCYYCAETGYVSAAQMASFLEAEQDAMADIHSGSFPDWADDGSWSPDEDDIRAEEDRRAQEAQMDWIDPSMVFVGESLTDDDIPF